MDHTDRRGLKIQKREWGKGKNLLEAFRKILGGVQRNPGAGRGTGARIKRGGGKRLENVVKKSTMPEELCRGSPQTPKSWRSVGAASKKNPDKNKRMMKCWRRRLQEGKNKEARSREGR